MRTKKMVLHGWKYEEMRRRLGGKCVICGGKSNLSFHHIDPKQKKFKLSRRTYLTLDALWEEAKKCVLLCRGCHGKLHQGRGQDYSPPTEKLRIRRITGKLDRQTTLALSIPCRPGAFCWVFQKPYIPRKSIRTFVSPTQSETLNSLQSQIETIAALEVLK